MPPSDTAGVGLLSATATSLIRKMRGQSQAHLVMCDDEHSYVVKFSNNPRHRRVLVNELIASALLRHLHISTPQTAIIRITDGFLRDNPGVYLQLRTERRSVMPGCHFGSRYPVEAGKASVYDFLPDALLKRVVNMSDYVGAYVVDKWLGKSDAPQSIFVHAPLERSGFVMYLIDHTHAFYGEHWRFHDSSENLYFRPSVYRQVTSIDSFQPWLDEVMAFPESTIEQARKQVPDEWLERVDVPQLEAVLEQLVRRRNRVAGLIRPRPEQTASRFPNWNNATKPRPRE